MIARTSFFLLALSKIAFAEDPPNIICAFYEAYSDTIPNATDFCSCEEFVSCFMPNACGEPEDIPDIELESGNTTDVQAFVDGEQCAENLSMNISLTPDGGQVLYQACGTYATQGLLETCINAQGPPAITEPTISECLNVTYGGELCSCEVCNGGQGLDIDCTAFNANATSNGCQVYNANDMNTLLPAFGMDPMAVDDAQEILDDAAEEPEEPEVDDSAGSSGVQKFGALMVISSVLASTIFL